VNSTDVGVRGARAYLIASHSAVCAKIPFP